MNPIAQEISENIETEIDNPTDVISSKLNSDSVNVTIKDIGIYSHPYMMYRELDRYNERKEKHFAQFDTFIYPSKPKSYSLLPFLHETNQKIEPEPNFKFREFTNWLLNIDYNALDVYYEDKADILREFAEFAQISSVESGQISSLLSVSIIFEDEETGLKYIGITPVYDKTFSVEQFIEDTTLQNEDTLEVQESQVKLEQSILKTNNWSISLHNIYSPTWYSMPVYHCAKYPIRREQLQFIKQMETDWFEIEAEVNTDPMTQGVLTIEFAMGNLKIGWGPSINKDSIAYEYLKHYNSDKNTLPLELHTFADPPTELDDHTSYTYNNSWLVRPPQK